MPSSPTPSERDASDASARAKEAAEQALLPYKWTQTISDVDITVPVAGNLRGRDIVVELSKTYIKVGVKGKGELIIDVSITLVPFFRWFWVFGFSMDGWMRAWIGLLEAKLPRRIYTYAYILMESVSPGNEDD